MPPKVTITKELVLEGAFETVRAHGPERLTARAVAETLGCSTQPIYRAFGSMNELRESLLERVALVATRYLVGESEDSEAEESSFLAFGYGTLRFAQEEPHLYRMLTNSARTVGDLLNDQSPPEFILGEMRKIPELAHVDDSRLRRIHRLLWFFSLGIASLFGVETKDDPMPMAREHLAMAGEAVIAWELGRQEQ